jgi:O-methyltransferase
VNVQITEGASLYLDLLKKTLTGSIYDESAWWVVEPRMAKQKDFLGVYGWIKATIIQALRKKSLLLVRTRPYDPARREGGNDWPMVGFTMVGHRRLDNIRACIESVIANKISGDFVECGVWRGGSAIFAKAVFKVYGVTDRKVWLADSFEGMPALETAADSVDADLSWMGYLAVSQEDVEHNFRRFDLFDDGVRFIKGWFSESLPGAPIEQIAILRLDGDHYSSTMDALTSLHGKLSKGGFVIVDDYVHYAGCRAAVTEFRAAHGITSKLIPIDDWAVYWRE